MGIQVFSRNSIRLPKELRGLPHAYRRNLSSYFARSDKLASSIAQSLRNGQTVVLLDVNYKSPLFGEKRPLEECVKAELGAKAHLASEVINLDHHSKELGNKTATELVFENLFNLRNLRKTVNTIINHGDTDSVVATFVANNIDRDFSPQEKAFLIAAARAGDHSEGDFLAPKDKLSSAVRLNLALDQICYEKGIDLRQVWRTDEKQIQGGMKEALQLIENTLRDVRALYTPEAERLIEANSVRLSYNIVERASQGQTVAGVTIDRTIAGLPVVIVDVTKPGLDNFNPIPAYKASSNPAIILIVRNGKVFGIGRNEAHAAWLPLGTREEDGSLTGIYGQGYFDGRIAGGQHAGGCNLPPARHNELPSTQEGLRITLRYLARQAVINRKADPFSTDEKVLRRFLRDIPNYPMKFLHLPQPIDGHGGGKMIKHLLAMHDALDWYVDDQVLANYPEVRKALLDPANRAEFEAFIALHDIGKIDTMEISRGKGKDKVTISHKAFEAINSEEQLEWKISYLGHDKRSAEMLAERGIEVSPRLARAIEFHMRPLGLIDTVAALEQLETAFPELREDFVFFAACHYLDMAGSQIEIVDARNEYDIETIICRTLADPIDNFTGFMANYFLARAKQERFQAFAETVPADLSKQMESVLGQLSKVKGSVEEMDVAIKTAQGKLADLKASQNAPSYDLKAIGAGLGQAGLRQYMKIMGPLKTGKIAKKDDLPQFGVAEEHVDQVWGIIEENAASN